MEKHDTRTRLLDAALGLLGTGGGGAMTVRTVESAAGVSHGSVRHHFGDRAGLTAALFDRLAEREAEYAVEDIASTLRQWLGAGRTLALARYELFLMAARDPALRPPLLAARDRFVARAAERVGSSNAPAVVAALDGLVLDALIRGTRDRDSLRSSVAVIIGGTG